MLLLDQDVQLDFLLFMVVPFPLPIMLRCDFYFPWFGWSSAWNQPSVQFLRCWFLQWGSPDSPTSRNMSNHPTASEFAGDTLLYSFLLATHYCRKIRTQTIQVTLTCTHTWICINFIVSKNKHGKPTEVCLPFSLLLFMCLSVAKKTFLVSQKKSIVCLGESFL